MAKIWLGVVDDFRTANWAELTKYPGVIWDGPEKDCWSKEYSEL